MQLRFDGSVGFPGGLIDPGDESVVTGLNREVVEEMGYNLPELAFTNDDFVVAHYCPRSHHVLYFFAKPVSTEQFKHLERCTLAAQEYGYETQGVIRVPCYTMDDGQKGLPVYLTNSFAGNAKCQLFAGLYKGDICSLEELRTVLHVAKCMAPMSE
ncbi:hypothetical protein P879_01671 [Paragonimus westermani]|uniref:U8 snoRNA-decapping enzyme n=1 Tax=Paragonimus westermani TaxID=34504 RepID=A0A8T0DAM0_9TREM|nr:hypothetical protein P879_01671 [Paragonimus westermani]